METVDADERSYEEETAEVSPLNVIPPCQPCIYVQRSQECSIAHTERELENQGVCSEMLTICRHAQSERENSKAKYVITRGELEGGEFPLPETQFPSPPPGGRGGSQNPKAPNFFKGGSTDSHAGFLMNSFLSIL